MTIGVGVIGYGPGGRLFHAPFIAPAGMALRAVATSRADEVARDHPGVEAVADPYALIARDDVHLVVISTPNDSHAPLAEAALKAGRHVVIDKPFALSTAEADRLIALAEARGLVLSGFQNRRLDADFLTVRRLLAAGTLGDLLLFENRWDRYRPTPLERWTEQAGKGSGILFNLGPHLIDQALTLFGMPDWLFADVTAQRPESATDDAFHILMGKGPARIVLAARSVVADNRARMAVHGTRGSYVKEGLDPQEEQLRAGMAPTDPGFGVEPPGDAGRLTTAGADGRMEAQTYPTATGDHVAYYRGIRDAIVVGDPPPVLAREARATIRVIEAARQSSETGRRIDLSG